MSKFKPVFRLLRCHGERILMSILCLMLTLVATATVAQERGRETSSISSADGAVQHRALADTISRQMRSDEPRSDPLIKRLDEVFNGIWSFRILDYRILEDEVLVLVELSAGSNVRQQFGSSERKDDRGGTRSVGEALKIAAQDALSRAVLLFDLWSRPDMTHARLPPVAVEVPPATDGPSEAPAVTAVSTAASPISSSSVETWFDPATTRYVGTPMEPNPIDNKKIAFSNYMLEAVRITTPPKLDGYLDDPVWRQAAAAAGFRQREPDEGFLDTQNTEVRVLYDAGNLYFGVMCYDREIEKVVATEMRRDEQLDDDDTVELYIAPEGDNGDTYFFGTNPLGARLDILFGPGLSSFSMDWDATWQCYVKRHSMGWSVEFVLPFKIFRFKSEARQDWAVNFGRFVQRTRGAAFWVPVARADGFLGSVEYGKGGRIVGLEGIKPGRAFEVLPYSVMGTIGERRVTGSDERTRFGLRREAGMDLKWGITSNITANATVNPDFAQIEADREVVNLSRFEFRFDEKRPFFLEGTSIFQFGGGLSSPLPIFFSRRIGTQLFDGSTVRILHGEKVSGKIGRTNIGMLNVHTRESPWASVESDLVTVADTTIAESGALQVALRDTLSITRTSFTEPETNWNVFRLKQDLFGRSTLGIIGLMKEPEDTPDNHTDLPGPRLSDTQYNRVVGGDLRLQFNSTEHQVNLLAARSWLPVPELQRRVLAGNDSTLLGQNALEWAGAITHSWRNAWMNTSASYTDIRAGFFADMGFVTRQDIRQATATIGVDHLFRRWGIRRIGSGGERGRGSLFSGNWIASHRGGLFDRNLVESWDIKVNPGMEFENGLRLSFGWERNFDRLDGSTVIANVSFPAGPYTFDSFTAGLSTDRGKPVSIQSTYTQGIFYDGRRRTVDTEITLKPMYRARIEPILTYNRLEREKVLNAPWFDERWIPRLRLSYSFSPNLFVSAFTQMNANKGTPDGDLNVRALVSNFLFAYTMPQGHTFFLAYNQFSDDDFDPLGQRRLRPASQAIVAKFSYLFNL